MRLKILVLLMFFILGRTIFAQISEEIERINSDSLLKALPELEGTEKIDTLDAIAFRVYLDFPDSGGEDDKTLTLE
ncbi:MAG: hypothetical protein U9R60_06565 [Bacteroidota bacterium]|nr:hypothetical protein [Bacteroidota bacterium]